MEKVIVTIDADGNVTAETQGFKGQGCLAVGKLLAELGDTASVKRTAEFYEDDGAVKRLVTR